MDVRFMILPPASISQAPRWLAFPVRTSGVFYSATRWPRYGLSVGLERIFNGGRNMTLKNWLDKQGFPHGMECVGLERLQQLWDAAQHEMRDKCANVAESWATDESATTCANIAEAIRRSNI